MWQTSKVHCTFGQLARTLVGESEAAMGISRRVHETLI